MAYTTLVFKNPETDLVIRTPVGFSWTLLIFGPWVPLIFRGTIKWAVIIFCLDLATLGLSRLVHPFIYNKLYIKRLISTGFKVRPDEVDKINQISQKLGFELPLLEIDATVSTDGHEMTASTDGYKVTDDSIQWHFKNDLGFQQGPVNGAALKALFRAGKIDKTTSVRPSGESQWVAFSKILERQGE